MAASSRTGALFTSKGNLFKHFSYHRFARFRHLQLKNSSKFIIPETRLDDKTSTVLNSSGHLVSHSGIMRSKCITLSSRLENTVNILIEKYPLNNLVAASESFARSLWARQVPIEINEKKKKLKEISAKVLEKSKMQNLNEDVLEKKLQQKIILLMKEQTYNWQSIKYDAYKSFLYMVSRMPANYAAILLCLNEIVKRVPDYIPRNVFDFGSGTGSTIWACNKIWNKNIFEYFAHDVSADMNILCRLLLQDGEEQKEMHVSGVYLRQFMPSQREKLYNLVVCSYSLFELESRQARLKVIHNLWDLTEDFLIVIENGTNSGFQLISEVRDTILKRNSESSDEATVFSPCPHDLPCPMIKENKESKKIPCNFQVTFKHFDFVAKNKKITERFCYIILQKGKRKDVLGTNWPRILQSPRKHSKHIHLKTCCPNGEIEHSFLTMKKHGKEAYKCASCCKWGDLLPVATRESPQTASDTTKSIPKTEPDTELEDNLSENHKTDLNQETKQIIS
ncbi:17, mitochondrial [Octopus vulgaris]|uniref:17, mitochondrial n=2 Tax=Octopus TaxID=6643 RepID=A0AA36BJW3_OCTVU|nr:methyltransferase-like protein 17, mitochondrial isoform X2 [Octopus sinensis]CAI9735478.1 17, mitochondrial [Octopus vulgaris]